MAGMTEPLEVVLRSELVTLVMAKVVVVAFASVVFPVNELVPENVLLSASSVDEAKVQVLVEYAYTEPEPLTASPPAERPVRVRAGKETDDVATNVPVVILPIVLDEMYAWLA
jgi:hypothetical protein